MPPGDTSLFQPTLLAFTRSDLHGLPQYSMPSGFNPRSSRSRGAPPGQDLSLRILIVSTHAPRVHEERLGFALPGPVVERVLTHAPRVHEERPAMVGLSVQSFAVSTHAPRVHEERPRCSPLPPSAPSFNPRSSRSRGATAHSRVAQRHHAVSTHAPRVHEERHQQWRARAGGVAFQPTLLAFTRSDGRSHSRGASSEFQPTLLAFTRSDRCASRSSSESTSTFQATLLALTRSDRAAGAGLSCAGVSTHAPRVHEERPWSIWWASTTSWSFNPRSSRSRGATSTRRLEDAIVQVSTHAPRVHEERLGSDERLSGDMHVSTHAPRVHEERLARKILARLSHAFQPTPLAFTRSDSAFGRLRGSERFQPTPLAFTRSDSWRLRPTWRRTRFNPRPSRSRGATREAAGLDLNGWRFQPTPLAFTRSDFIETFEGPEKGKFQPTPPRSRGATSHSPWLRSSIWFQPTPSRSRGATQRVRSPCASSTGFNPRPSRSRGATRPAGFAPVSPLFQPTPLAFTRSDSTSPRRASQGEVSTHAPRVHEERPSMWSRSKLELLFQPTPLAFTRSDHQRHQHPLRGRVSTHAPRVHEERQVGPRCLRHRPPVSTHAPRVHEERHACGPSIKCATTCFNPRPSRSRGATSRIS
ncbi:Transketolase [Myxococcus hansupus]|uniref:Transketolase n=1 Tax=Pseudomyxococcus hansupus TaxID=1297742 RepID=A0A0H4X5U7_9BACT|nr:Transketolase [Myxococcus hansupus]